MGIFKVISSCGHLEPTPGCWDCGSKARGRVVGCVAGVPPSTPNPRNFVIERLDDQGDWTLVMARYPDATNYEGRKILVYRHPAEVVRTSAVLDPHFCDDPKCISPFARFEPTEDGWLAAYVLVRELKKARVI